MRDAGSQEHAETHAELAREFVMGALGTHYDLEMATTVIRRDFEASMASLRHAVVASICDMQTSIATRRNDVKRP